MFALALTFVSAPAIAQKQKKASTQNQKKLSDQEILNMYKGLRVADVSDGPDIAGLPDVGLMDQRIQALWKNIDKLNHQFTGIAVTARYVPTVRYLLP